MEGLTTRPATAEDIDRILAFIRAKAAFDGAPPEAVEATPGQLRRTLFGERPLEEVLLAERDDRAVGFASFYRTYSSFLCRPCLWLDDLFVLPEERGTGVGTALMRHLARIARDQGCGRIEWTVNASNGRAITFYRKHGASLKTDQHVCRADRAAIDRLAEAV